MAIQNKIAKPFKIGSKRSIVIAQFSKYKIMIKSDTGDLFDLKHTIDYKFLSGSRGPDGPDYHRPPGENSSFQFLPVTSYEELFSDRRPLFQ